ncbi:MAG: M56 family metallopeptidase [Planctomycetes bacterium]|nr:M56 family metallopeptidase [Planctomycetota bacterium]
MSAALGGFVLTWAAHALVALLAIGAAARWARLGDGWLDALWRLALAAPLMTAAIQCGLGVGPRALVGVPTPHAPVAERAIAAAAGETAPRPRLPDGGRPEPVAEATALGTDPAPNVRRPRRPALEPAAAPPPAAVERAAQVPLDASPQVARVAWIAVGPPRAIRLGARLAALAALLGLARLGLLRVRLRRALADRRLVTDPALLATCEELALRAGLRRPPRLSTCTALASPIAFGVLRPEICLPARAATALSPSAQRALLAHELAHHQRRDPLWLELGHALVALFPWHPLPHVALRRARALAEYRCDALATRLAGAVPLAECLVEVAGWQVGRGSAVELGVVAGMALRHGGLEARVDRLLADEGPVRGPSPRRVAALALAAVAATVATAPAIELDLPSTSVSVAADRTAAPPALAAAARALPSAPAAPQPPAELALTLELVELEREALDLELALLRDDLGATGADPEIRALLAGVDARLAALDARRADLAAAVQRTADHVRTLPGAVRGAGSPR